jgi:tetratricopeptide (TPR) repeat protein
VILTLTGSFQGQQPPAKPAPSPARPKAGDPFATAPAGQVSTQKTDQGILVVSNVPGNRYTYSVVGAKISRVNYENKQNPHARIWDVDGIVIQSVPVPLSPDAKLNYVQEVLLEHHKYESDHVAQGGFKEIASARQWLNTPTGVGLYWELHNPAPAPTDKGTKKMLFANATNGRNVVLFGASILPNVDEAKAKKLLIETAKSFRRYEKDVAVPLNSGDATSFLVNDEIGTKQSRNAPGALVVKPEIVVMMMRMAFELSPPRKRLLMTGLHDGKSGHMINVVDYDAKTKRFHYSDTLGNTSFLMEDNNRAGVKAERVPGKDRLFSVTVPEMQSVVEAVVMMPFFAQRSYFTTQSMEGAITEYRALQRLDPKSAECTEANLLRAAQILREFKEDARAVNVYAVCRALHAHSSRALAGIAEVYSRIGRLEPAMNFYADALKSLPKDPSVPPAQREQLAAAWEKARNDLSKKPKPATSK